MANHKCRMTARLNTYKNQTEKSTLKKREKKIMSLYKFLKLFIFIKVIKYVTSEMHHNIKSQYDAYVLLKCGIIIVVVIIIIITKR